MKARTINIDVKATKAAERLRRAANVLDGPTFGDRIEDGGVMGTIIRCHECGGSGQLHELDQVPATVEPEDA